MINIYKKIFKLALFPLIFIDYFSFLNKITTSRFKLKIKDFYPQIKDKTIKTGFDRHYVYHTSWAARKVKEINPTKHIDISSSLYFSGIVSAFIPVDFYDFRPADIKMSDLKSNEGNLLNLPFENESINCLSCMHTIEHIGLGRYGDQIDPDGDLKAIKELDRVLAKEGNLLFVTPIGKEAKIEFNAHRIYTYEQIINYFSNLNLIEFTLIPEKSGDIIINANPELIKNENYACGCFWFKK